MTLDSTTILRPEAVLVDRVELNVNRLHVLGIGEEQFQSLMVRLGGSDEYSLKKRPWDESPSWMFVRCRRITPRGRLFVNPGRTDGSVKFYWNLTLNPTRILSSSLSKEWLAGEFSLDGKDNWLPSSWIGQEGMVSVAYLLSQCIEEQVGRVVEELRNHLTAVCDGSNFDILPPSLSISKIEAYTQSPSDDPVGEVYRLESQFRKVFNSSQTRNYPAAPGLGHEKNCPALSARLRRGLKLVVYAKTDRSIRCEIRADKNFIRSRFGSNQLHGDPGIEVLKLAESIYGFALPWLRRIVESPPRSTNSATLAVAIMKIAQAARGDVRSFRLFASRIGYAGTLSTGRRFDKARKALSQPDGILEWRPREPCPLRPEYECARALLRQIAGQLRASG